MMSAHEHVRCICEWCIVQHVLCIPMHQYTNAIVAKDVGYVSRVVVVHYVITCDEENSFAVFWKPQIRSCVEL